ncbi:MAG: zinc ABC transporter substrate-binding protein [Bdellovibrionales bacterium]|nr:zinc ABC transporter substrate-binding protein [Bdellovibrionales bacterium]
MKFTKSIFNVVVLILLSYSRGFAGELKVVSTLTTFADIASQIGGPYVEVSSIASPRFNPHFVEPKPTDVLRVKRSDLFIHSGLDLELWKDSLVNAAARAEVRAGGQRELNLASAVQLLEVPTGVPSRAEGDIHLHGNPHYWLDPNNGIGIAKRITEKLTELDVEHAEVFLENFNQFVLRMKSKMAEWQKQSGNIRGHKVIGYHNEWVYLTDYLGLQMERFIEPKSGISPGPQHIQTLKQYITSSKIRGIFQASFYPRIESDLLAHETGVTVKILCQNVHELPQCSDYLAMLDFNIRSIVEVFHNE